jgi:hypothetical protein
MDLNLLHDGLSSAMGTKTLIAHDMESESLTACKKEDDSAGGEFRRYPIAGTTIHPTET